MGTTDLAPEASGAPTHSPRLHRAVAVSERRRAPVAPEAALLLAERRTNREIAAALAISVHTARHHVEAVLERLDVARAEVGRALHRS